MEKQTAQPRRNLLLVGFVIVLVGAAALVYYVGTLTNSSGSNSSINSSLSSEVSSLQVVVSSQNEAIQSLSSAAASASTTTVTVSRTETTTVNGANTTTITKTVTGGTGGGTTSTVTSTLTKTLTTTSLVTTSVGGPDYFEARDSLSLTGTNGSGNLTISITNEGYDPIVGITVTVPAGNDSSVDLCTTSCTLQVLYNGAPVSSAASVPGGVTVSGSVLTDEGQAATAYSVQVVITFGDGVQQAQALQITAQNA